jgi:hypothetical protein
MATLVAELEISWRFLEIKQNCDVYHFFERQSGLSLLGLQCTKKDDRRRKAGMRVVDEITKGTLLAALWLTVSGIIAGFVASALL